MVIDKKLLNFVIPINLNEYIIKSPLIHTKNPDSISNSFVTK